MNLISFSPQFEKMRNFMLDIENKFEPLSYVAQSLSNSGTYPPHNIYKEDNKYVIEMALAGFSKEDVVVEIEPNLLVVKTTKETKTEDDPLDMYKYKGIAKRAFRRVFYLADLMRVVSCKMENGMLHIEIEKEIPEEQKPKQITIE